MPAMPSKPPFIHRPLLQVLPVDSAAVATVRAAAARALTALRGAPARVCFLALVLGGLSAMTMPARAAAASTEPAAAALSAKPCRLKGVEFEALCGTVKRALDPAQPKGTQIDVHYAVLPALARRKAADPVFFFAGGPGQSAIDLAGPLSRRYARLGQRRDLVFVDQRGTGRSAPLKCADDDERSALRPLAEGADPAARLLALKACGVALRKLPHGDLRQYTTSIAVADVDAVRAALGAPRINAIGASYGTRAVLEYQRQFAPHLRRAVIDGVAPPDMVLPASFSTDNQAALDAVFSTCEGEAACHTRYPQLRQHWHQLLARLPLQAMVAHPMTGQEERLTITSEQLLGAVRGPLYAPTLAAALPAALHQASQLRFGAVLGLSAALGLSGGSMATGMHFSVICAEDMPRLDRANDAPGADFGRGFADIYRQVCVDWPRGQPPPEFYRITPAQTAVLVLSGGADPATPPRHGERAANALGAKARHVVAAAAGHGVLGLACVRDAAMRFIDAASDDAALKVETGCAAAIPRPLVFVPLQVDAQAKAQASAVGKP